MPKIIDDAQVYQAAMETIVERGYAGATTRQIAKAAGMSEMTLFRKYGSKAALIKQAFSDLAEEVDFESATRYTGNVEDDLLRVVTMYQGAAEEKGQFIYTMVLEVQRNPELADSIDRPLLMFKQIAQLLGRYQKEGFLRPEHPLQALAGLLGPLIAANIMRNALQDLPFPAANLEDHVACFLNGRYSSQYQEKNDA